MKYLSHYYRYLWQGPELIVIVGNAANLWQGLREYGEKFSIAPGDSAGGAAVQRMLAGAGLAAVSLPERESWGWTLSLPESSIGLFCAVEPEGMACVCLRESALEADAAVVQRQVEKSPLTQSHSYTCLARKRGSPQEAKSASRSGNFMERMSGFSVMGLICTKISSQKPFASQQQRQQSKDPFEVD